LPQFLHLNGFKPERREVEIGEFTDEFVEVKSGVKEGEQVLFDMEQAAQYLQRLVSN